MARYGRLRPQAVVPLSDHPFAPGRRDTQLGTLARSLATAERLGVVVPETWVVVADVLRHVVASSLPPGHDPASLLRTIRRPVGVERAARARERLLTVTLDVDIEREIDGAFRALAEASPWGIAVRASALVGDTGVARAALLSSTELAVFGREELGRAIRRAWARTTSEATLRYLRARRVREVALAIVLQPVVVARANVRLVTDARTVLLEEQESRAVPERLVVALPGLGAEDADVSSAEIGLIEGSGGFRVLRPLGSPGARVVRGGTLRIDEPAPYAASLAEPHVSELSEIARRLETLGPMELACVIPERGEITLVDSCPASHQGHPGTGTGQTLWARAAAGDAPALPLTPLARDLLSDTLALRVRRARGDRGRRGSRGEGTVAIVSGRPYVDLSRLVEGGKPSDFVDSTGRTEIIGAQWEPLYGGGAPPRASLARAGLRIAQMAAEQRVLSDDVSRFEKEAETERRWLAEMDLAILPDDALTTTLHEVSGFLSRAEDLHARATVTAVSGHALLASVLAGAEPSRASFLAHAVTAGADVITAKPASALCHVAAIGRYDEAGAAFLTSPAPNPGDAPEGPLLRAVRRFLEAFGDRGVAEAELSTPRWAEDPRPILALLSALQRKGTLDPDVALSRARALADRELALLEPRLSFFEIRLVRDIVSRVRDFLRLRERCRLRVAHGLSMMRVVTLDVDRRIRRLDPALEPGDAFCLTVEELGSAVAKYRADLAPIVRARREDLARERRSPGPPPVFRGAPPIGVPVHRGPVVHGVAASGGEAVSVVTKIGAALEGLSRFTPGSVVVLRSLDVGLCPLLVHAGAVVAELGTPFSSTSVVARDYGVPVVSGVRGAWALLRDGDRVRVDGSSGTVESLPA